MSSVLQSPSELMPKSLKARNAAAEKLLMSWCSMASPVLKMLQAASQGILSHQLHPQEVIDPHWSPLHFGACRPDLRWKDAGWPDFGLLVQRPEPQPGVGRNSCGHFCSRPL